MSRACWEWKQARKRSVSDGERVEVDSLSAPGLQRVGCGSRGEQKHTHTGLDAQYDPTAGDVEGAERQRARIRTSLFPALCLRTDLEVLKRQRKRRSVEKMKGGLLQTIFFHQCL